MTDRPLAPALLERLQCELEELRESLLADEASLADAIERVHPDNRASARNLIHYLALRRRDVRRLQMRLARRGLSSLGRAESHVLVTLNRMIAMLALARGVRPPSSPAPPVGFRQGDRLLSQNARRLLGPLPAHRAVRIAVTLPAEAAEDPRFVYDLVEAGMDCARINCARDDADAWTAMAENVRSAERAQARACRILADLGGPKLRTGPIPGGAKRLLLAVDDRFELVAASRDAPPRNTSLPRITCTVTEIFDAARPGEPIWFDDGRIGGVIEERTVDGFLIHVTSAKVDGSKLRPERGINLPETTLSLPALSARDRQDLATVVPWADAIELSFVQKPEDVVDLTDALHQLNAAHLGVILKIETRQGFADLPRLLLAAMRHRCCGVMIARGDLAVEAGFERMAEVQEEILWIAEAAHAPTIWATQVLDNLAKEGMLSRAEITDAAMSARAEAVLLSKGPFIIDAIRTLDNVLSRMAEHQTKKRALFRALDVSSSLWS